MDKKRWTLSKLAPQGNGEKRWSIGAWGPRVYLTCDAKTARLIRDAVNAYKK